MKHLILWLIILLASSAQAFGGKDLAGSAQAFGDKEKKEVLIWINVAAAVADVESTQHAFSKGTAREGNPFSPSGREAQYAVKAAVLVPLSVWYLKSDSPAPKWLLVGFAVAQFTVFGFNLRF